MKFHISNLKLNFCVVWIKIDKKLLPLQNNNLINVQNANSRKDWWNLHVTVRRLPE